jgi:hypothetical protein
LACIDFVDCYIGGKLTKGNIDMKIAFTTLAIGLLAFGASASDPYSYDIAPLPTLAPLPALAPLPELAPLPYAAPATTTLPRARTSYSYDDGATYSTQQQIDGSTRVNGYSTRSGAQWNTNIKANGDMTGTDAKGNYWQYNRQTGSYTNTNGKVCTGTGHSRICNK